MSLHIQRLGKGSPLVLFHGWGFDSQIFHPLIPTLSENFQLFLVDLPGFGASALMDWEDFKGALLEQLPPQFFLIGWSMGGLYATRLASETPHRVQRLLNMCSSPCFVSQEDWPGIKPLVLQAFHRKLSRNTAQTLREFVSLQTGGQFCHRLEGTPEPDPKALQLGLAVLGDWDLRHSLSSLSLPIAYLFGRLDAIVPIQVMKVMQARYPNIECNLLQGAGHLPFVSHTQACVAILQGFFL